MSPKKSTAKKHRKPSAKKPARQPKAKPQPTSKPAAAEVQQGGNPYRQGTMYACLFELGSKDYIQKDELIRRVAQLCPKKTEERLVEMGYQVLASKGGKHRSNKHRSTVLVNEDGRVKLIALKRRTAG